MLKIASKAEKMLSVYPNCIVWSLSISIIIAKTQIIMWVADWITPVGWNITAQPASAFLLWECEPLLPFPLGYRIVILDTKIYINYYYIYIYIGITLVSFGIKRYHLVSSGMPATLWKNDTKWYQMIPCDTKTNPVKTRVEADLVSLCVRGAPNRKMAIPLACGVAGVDYSLADLPYSRIEGEV